VHEHPAARGIGQRRPHAGQGSQVHLNRYSHSCTIQPTLNQHPLANADADTLLTYFSRALLAGLVRRVLRVRW
jgi:hypothetical protein